MIDRQHGLAVNRSSFHQALQIEAERSGVQNFTATISKRKLLSPSTSRSGPEILLDGEKHSGNWMIDATGRGHSTSYITRSKRITFSQNIALALPIQATSHAEALLIDAVEDGWWYLSPATGKRRDLVFVTDKQTLRSLNCKRSDWLSAQLRKSETICDILDTDPDWNSVYGVDARFAALENPINLRTVAVGDAALALDPLSGQGSLLAIKSAAILFHSILNTEKGLKSYESWIQQAHKQEFQLCLDTYRKASHRFPNSGFWKRHI
ncbi:NAD(P)/FAD-dependent oxidoreductase [Roseibacillus persicicus]|nr:hypothetical protein [Roseibacillus persicicus]